MLLSGLILADLSIISASRKTQFPEKKTHGQNQLLKYKSILNLLVGSFYNTILLSYYILLVTSAEWGKSKQKFNKQFKDFVNEHNLYTSVS